MKKEISVYIPEPCHENWNNMLPAEKGRFCNACAKQVIDFSLMSDTQIINYFKNSTGRVCGRFAEDQLQRSLQPVTQPKKKTWWMALTMPLMFLFNKSEAQETKVTGDTTVFVPEEKITRLTGVVALRNTEEAEKKKITFHVKLVDDGGNAVPFAMIHSLHTDFKTMTNPGGYFTYETDSLIFNDTLHISALNCRSIDIAAIQLINNPDSPIILTRMVSGVTAILTNSLTGKAGGISICSTKVTTEEKIDSAIKKITRKELFSVLPNPVIRGNQIKVQFKKSSEYSLFLLDNSSNFILSKIANPEDGTTIPFTIPQNIAAGIYYLRAIDEKAKKSFTQKIIIQ